MLELVYVQFVRNKEPVTETTTYNLMEVMNMEVKDIIFLVTSICFASFKVRLYAYRNVFLPGSLDCIFFTLVDIQRAEVGQFKYTF